MKCYYPIDYTTPFWQKFRTTIEDELKLFLALADHFGVDLNLDHTDIDEELLPEWDSSILSTVPLEKIDPKRIPWECYLDIFDQDTYNYTFKDTRRPAVLYKNGVYVGHIWNLVEDEGVAYIRKRAPDYVDPNSDWIGIRSSLRNHINKITGREYTSVAWYLLTAALQVAEHFGKKKVVLNSPIGAMVEIAERFGFKYSESFRVGRTPNVIVDITVEYV